jgi:hypothetical protein
MDNIDHVILRSKSINMNKCINKYINIVIIHTRKINYVSIKI